MLKIEALSTWLKAELNSRGQDAKFTLNHQPPHPDKVITLTESPGAQSEMQEKIDVPTFQVRVRGFKDDPKSGRDLIHALDEIILDDTLRPFQLAGFHVFSMGRTGGAPSYLHFNQEGRTTYVCNYWIRIER